MLKLTEVTVLTIAILLGIIVTIVIGVNFEKIPIIIKVGLYNDEGFWESFMTNIHNMFLDYLIFGVIMVMLFKRIEEQRRAKDYYDFIEDYRGWKEGTESAIRISSYVRRLNEMRYYEFNLTRCSLFNSNLKNNKFENTKFEGTILKETDFNGARFKKCVLKGNNADGIKLNGSRFYESKCINLWAKGIKANGTVFKNCDLIGVDFSEGELNSVSFIDCSVQNIKLNNAVLKGVNFKTASGITIDDLINCKSISKSCKFSEELWSQIKSVKPDIVQ